MSIRLDLSRSIAATDARRAKPDRARLLAISAAHGATPSDKEGL